MEESLTFLEKIKETFSLGEIDLKTYSPLTLAFIGDAVFELIIRTAEVSKGNRDVNGLHKSKSRIVNATVQAKISDLLLPELTEEELACFKRGRNAKSHTIAKNASVGDYRKATGLEALIGYLYLSGQEVRMLELTKTGLEKAGISI